jgi:hypothetical protein
MFGSLIVALLVIAVGERATDAVERRQHELVLRKLPLEDAHDYYQRLRRRDRRMRVLRAFCLGALLVLGYVYRRHLVNESRRVQPVPQVVPRIPLR